MPLRGSNNPTTDLVVMTALKTYIPGFPTANTQLALGSQSGNGSEQIYIEQLYSLQQGAFPAVFLEAGEQRYHVVTRSGYDGVLTVLLTYFDRWDRQSSTIDAVWANIAADLERIKSNIASNPTLPIGGVPYAVSIPSISLSPYRGEIDKELVPSMWLARREMLLQINVLPFDESG